MGGFLSGLFGGLASGLGGALGGSLGGAVSQSLFGRKDRLSSSDAQHNEILLDRHQANQNQRDIRTIHEMLPSQAMAHNYMRDQTFHQDTAAMDQRNKELWYDKGLSPWELAGTSAASPLPVASPEGAQSGKDPGMLQAQMQMEMQHRQQNIQAATALQQTKMQTEAQKDVAKINTDPQHEANRIKDREVFIKDYLAMAQTDRWKDMTKNEKAQINLDIVKKITDLLPEEQLDTILVKWKGKQGWRDIVALLEGIKNSGNVPNDIATKLPYGKLEGAAKILADEALKTTRGEKSVLNPRGSKNILDWSMTPASKFIEEGWNTTKSIFNR